MGICKGDLSEILGKSWGDFGEIFDSFWEVLGNCLGVLGELLVTSWRDHADILGRSWVGIVEILDFGKIVGESLGGFWGALG